MSARASASAAVARAAGRASRLLGRGGGTSVPGVVLLKIDPGAVAELAARLGGGTALVSATNGKTTTTRLLAGALRGTGSEVVTNAAGANLVTGVAATLAATRPAVPATARGLFEVDEAALPDVARRVRPQVIVLMNLFRDQLDRHGELEAIADRWQAMLAVPGPGPRLVLAADDPAIAALGGATTCCGSASTTTGWDRGPCPTPQTRPGAGHAPGRSRTTRCGSGTSAGGDARGAARHARRSTSPSSMRGSAGRRGRAPPCARPTAR